MYVCIGKKYGYMVWYYPRFQASTVGLEMYPPPIWGRDYRRPFYQFYFLDFLLYSIDLSLRVSMPHLIIKTLLYILIYGGANPALLLFF